MIQRQGNSAQQDLENIPQIIPEDSLKQEGKDFETLYATATAAQEELADLTRKIAANINAEAVIPKIKTVVRAREKIDADFEGDFTRITDLARTTIVCNNIEQLVTAYKALASATEILQLKNRFKTPKANQYRDMNILLKLKISRNIGEVQLHLKRIQDIKSGPEHDIYARIQDITRGAKTKNRPLTQAETLEIAKLSQESKALYEEAWNSYLA